MSAEGPASARTRWRSVLSVVSAAEALAVTGWLLPASVHIVSWPAEGPVRLALLAPAWQLAAWLGVGLLASALLIAVDRRRPHDGGMPSGSVLDRVGGAMAPLSLLWVWAVPYLPWLPDQLPLLLVLAGPLRWVIAGVAVVGVVHRLGMTVTGRGRAWPGRPAIFALGLLVYAGLGLYATRSVGPGGDEPHYLIISESLRRDGDLRIDNNHRQGDYRAFWQGELRPDYFVRGKDGAIYSIHAPGLPALMLPFYAAGGRIGVVLFIGLLAALTALAVFDVAEHLAGRAAAWATWAACCLTVPFVPHAWLVFPEIPGALIVAWGVSWIARAADRPWAAWAMRGFAFSVLPWLHTKFVVLLAVLSAGIALRLLRRPAALTAFLAPIAVSGAAWLYAFYLIYGSFNPEAPYGSYSDMYVLARNIPHGLIGILFDQKFGLIVHSPIYLAAAAGAWLAIRRVETRFLGLVLLAAAALFVGSTARLYMFWGGSSAPARFLVPVLPVLTPFVALAVSAARAPAARALVGVSMAIGLTVAAAGVVRPERLMLFSDPHGRARLLEAMQAGSPLSLVVPTFTEPTWTSQIGLLAAWSGAALFALIVVLLAGRRANSLPFRLSVLFTGVFLVCGAVVTARPPADVRAETARRGDLAVWWGFDGTRFRTLDYSTLGRASVDRMRELTTLVAETPASLPDEAAILAGPFNLPPGRFEARVWFAGEVPTPGEVLVTTPAGIVFARATGLLDNPTTMRFELHVPTRRVVVRTAGVATAARPTRVELVPRAIVPPGERPGFVVRTLESLSDRLGAYLAYTDEHAYPEGGVFWSRGTATTRVVVAPAGATRLTLTLSTGPKSGMVTIAVRGQRHQVPMAAGELKVVSFDLPGAEALVPIDVQSSVMFRPAETDPASTDMRGLGCQVRVHLE